MQFLIIAKDFKEGGLERRMKCRADHVLLCDKLIAEGKYIYGVATLDDKGKMTGSVMIFDFPGRKELDEYMKIEPYILGNVWDSIEIIPCQPGPSFTEEHKKTLK